ncbi:hypothetical protein POM88_033858 [Heracleum sosnowskyi]|uniref:Uncharacterized protein n=1 Tax=Heracleum sosnowskyi TaxID=360622 RepID=A0AAD8HJM0_9APIA|nr:hypothetical protein POM88_033858 [Heracleum sosnowskyi]
MLSVMQEQFPELRVVREDCFEVSWLQAMVYFSGFELFTPPEILLNLTVLPRPAFKSNNDFTQVLILMKLNAWNGKYVAEKRNMNPKVCIPFDGITENTWEQVRGTLDVPRFRWWRCRSCVREPVTCSTTAQDSSLELTVHGGSLKKNETEPLAKAINMVDSIGEREIPNTISLEVLARLAVEMASGHPQLLETSQTSNAQKHISLERKTAGFGTDAIVGDGDKALIFTDVIDSEDERENKKTRLLKELIRVEVEAKAIAGKGATTHTLQRTEERPSSSKGKNINSEVHYNGQEFVRPEGSRKAKRICPFLPETNPTSRYFSETPVSQKRRKSNGGK